MISEKRNAYAESETWLFLVRFRLRSKIAVRVLVDTAVVPPSELAPVIVLMGRGIVPPLATDEREKRDALADGPGEFSETLDAEYTEVRFSAP